MAITSVTDAAIVQPDKAVGNKELGRSDFMTLFITQLQYQDPMKPMDSYEMASQLAQFSGMEATMKMSDNMEKLLEYQTSQNNLQILTLLGSEVMVEGNKMGVVDGEATATEFDISEQTDETTVNIYDSANRLVWQQPMGSLSSGTYQLDWDGKNAIGEQVADGPYSYVVSALSANGESLDVEYHSVGKVTGVDFADGKAVLTLDEYVQASVDEVMKVR